MTLRRVSLLGVSLLILGVAACDGRVAFPGFDKKPDTENSASPPDTLPPTPGLPAAENPPALPETIPFPSSDEIPPLSDTPEVTAPIADEPPEDMPKPAGDEPVPENDVSEGPGNTPVDDAEDDPAQPPAENTPPAETPSDRLDPAAPFPRLEPAFSYHAPGNLTPGSGQGSPDETVYAPDMVFPIETARAFPQSMVFFPGGFRYAGDLPGDECIPENYEYPWRDNFCERGRSSSFKSASCPAGSGVHLGQDIRVGDGPTCQSMRRRYRTDTQSITDYKVVAAEEGMISNISSYTVTLRAGPRTYRYLHMNMRALQVSVGDRVKAGQLLGYVSKDFGFDSAGKRRPTTFHLHFELRINTEQGSPFVPPYTSLVEAYARREGAPGERIERTLSIASDALRYDPNEVFEFSE